MVDDDQIGQHKYRTFTAWQKKVLFQSTTLGILSSNENYSWRSSKKDNEGTGTPLFLLSLGNLRIAWEEMVSHSVATYLGACTSF